MGRASSVTCGSSLVRGVSFARVVRAMSASGRTNAKSLVSSVVAQEREMAPVAPVKVKKGVPHEAVVDREQHASGAGSCVSMVQEGAKEACHFEAVAAARRGTGASAARRGGGGEFL